MLYEVITGNVILQTDAGGNRIEYTYNSRNLLVMERNLGTAESPITNDIGILRTYTADGKPFTVTARSGNVTTYTYDA